MLCRLCSIPIRKILENTPLDFYSFITPDTIHHPEWVLGVGIGGLIVNVIGLFLFGGK